VDKVYCNRQTTTSLQIAAGSKFIRHVIKKLRLQTFFGSTCVVALLWYDWTLLFALLVHEGSQAWWPTAIYTSLT